MFILGLSAGGAGLLVLVIRWVLQRHATWGAVDVYSLGGIAAGVGQCVLGYLALRSRPDATVQPLPEVDDDSAGKWRQALRSSVTSTRRTDHSRRVGQTAIPLQLAVVEEDGTVGNAAITDSELVSIVARAGAGTTIVEGWGGAGKTVMALQFVLDWNQAAGPGDPIAEVFTFTDWEEWLRRVQPSDPVSSLEPWLWDELAQRHNVPRGVGRFLTTAGLIVPVLDGLDELAFEKVADGEIHWTVGDLARSAVNFYIGPRLERRVVVMTRPEDNDPWRRNETFRPVARGPSRLRVASVSVPAALRYLEHVPSTHDWDAFRDLIRDGDESALAVVATPLRLYLLAGSPHRSPLDLLAIEPRKIDAELWSSQVTRAAKGRRLRQLGTLAFAAQIADGRRIRARELPDLCTRLRGVDLERLDPDFSTWRQPGLEENDSTVVYDSFDAGDDDEDDVTLADVLRSTSGIQRLATVRALWTTLRAVGELPIHGPAEGIGKVMMFGLTPMLFSGLLLSAALQFGSLALGEIVLRTSLAISCAAVVVLAARGPILPVLLGASCYLVAIRGSDIPSALGVGVVLAALVGVALWMVMAEVVSLSMAIAGLSPSLAIGMLSIGALVGVVTIVSVLLAAVLHGVSVQLAAPLVVVGIAPVLLVPTVGVAVYLARVARRRLWKSQLQRAGFLPWRIKKLLRWADTNGFLRRRGDFYEFRHRSLRMYLVRTSSCLTDLHASFPSFPKGATESLPP